MPTYEYECGNCGHRFEKFSRISESSGANCPQCQSPAERLISGGAGLLFKGSGFYITDYRSDSYKKAASKEKGGTEGASPASDKPTADKPKDKATGKDKASKKG